jgi:hypothetical protein
MKKLKFRYFSLIKRGKSCFKQRIKDSCKTYWINPDQIELSIIPDHIRFGSEMFTHPLDELGLVIDGDWDRETIPFKELDVFQAIEDVFINGQKWENTSFYIRIAGYFQDGLSRWDCHSLQEFDQRLVKLEALFNNIKEHGYLSQKDLYKIDGPDGKEDEIVVHIGRNGEYIFAEGRHRLSIAKILGVKKVAVKIARQHKKWIDSKKRI